MRTSASLSRWHWPSLWLLTFLPVHAGITKAMAEPNPLPRQMPEQKAKVQTQELLSAPSPRPRLKKGEYISIKSQNPLQKLVIAPKSPEVAPKPGNSVTYFELVQENNQLILRFRSADPQLHLSRTNPIVIQLITKAPFQINPSIILNADWPKNSTQMVLQATGFSPNSDNRIRGKATYTYCHQSTQVCTETISPILYDYQKGLP